MSDKIKKLSQAIRLGATFRPQQFSAYATKGKTCALGAAMEAVGLLEFLPDDKVAANWDSMPFDLCARFKVSPADLNDCARQNDLDRLTREQIAAKLEAKGL